MQNIDDIEYKLSKNYCFLFASRIEYISHVQIWKLVTYRFGYIIYCTFDLSSLCLLLRE